jgi:hypothetical protein
MQVMPYILSLGIRWELSSSCPGHRTSLDAVKTEISHTSGMLRHVALVRTDVSEELSASFIRVTRIAELGTTLAVTSNLTYPILDKD